MSQTKELGDFRVDKRILLLCALALPIGVVSAYVARLLLWLIAFITNVAFLQKFSAAPVTPQQHHLGWLVIFVPVIGAIIIGLMARYGSDKIRGHGIPEALEAILLGRSIMDPKVAILKPLSSAISIGTGGPFGAEGPIIMTGGAFGSIFAQFFHLTSAERKTLLVAGAAAGMSAVFATPIAAILLAVELLLFEWKPRSFVPVALASVVASLVRVPLLGMGPIFASTHHAFLGSEPLLIALVVGLAAGFGSCFLTSIVYFFEDAFEKLPIHWMWWPAIGALLVGIGGYFEPRVLGVGYDTIEGLIHGSLLGHVLIALLIAKALVWSIALGSGTSGGVLAPLLIIGGGIGALTGGLFSGDVGLWALVGMSAMMGGTMRSPLTGMVFALELTGDLNALPALLVGCVTAMTITILLMRRSILTEKLARRGQHIAREYSVDPFELMRVGDVMEKDVPTVSGDMTLNELSDRIAKNDPAVCRRQAVLVSNSAGELEGIITRGDIMRHLQGDRRGEVKLSAAAHKETMIVAYVDEPLHSVVAKMLKHDIGRLPVVDHEDDKRIIGYLGRADVLAARLKAHEEEEVREKGPVSKTILKVPEMVGR